jgi:hypothetical protein
MIAKSTHLIQTKDEIYVLYETEDGKYFKQSHSTYGQRDMYIQEVGRDEGERGVKQIITTRSHKSLIMFLSLVLVGVVFIIVAFIWRSINEH